MKRLLLALIAIIFTGCATIPSMPTKLECPEPDTGSLKTITQDCYHQYPNPAIICMVKLKNTGDADIQNISFSLLTKSCRQYSADSGDIRYLPSQDSVTAKIVIYEIGKIPYNLLSDAYNNPDIIYTYDTVKK